MVKAQQFPLTFGKNAIDFTHYPEFHGADMEELTFEQALEELKSIVQALEKGDSPLEESLALFEKGVGLVGFCSRKLDEVEKKVEVLLKDQEGALKSRAFEERAES